MADKNPKKIEKEIYDVQDRIEDTVDRITEKLSVKSVLRSFLSDDANGENARMATDGVVQLVKQNPLAVGVIGAGVAWLISGKKTHPSEFRKFDDNLYNARQLKADDSYSAYIHHMAQVRREEKESETTYFQRRRDARSAYLLTERRTGEDDKSFEDRLDEAASRLKKKAEKKLSKLQRKLSDSKRTLKETASDTRKKGKEVIEQAQDYSAQLTERVKRTGQNSLTKGRETFEENPVAAGLAAISIGAVIGTLAPLSQSERKKLRRPSEKLREKAKTHGDKFTEKVKEKVSS